MDNWQTAGVVGIVLSGLGVLLMRSHQKAWRLQRDDAALDAHDQAYYQRRYRRRMQTSGLILLLGLLLPLGAGLMVWKVDVVLTTCYWIGVLLLTAWVAVMGVGDLVATGVHTRAALDRLRSQQQALEQQISDIKSRGSNGRDRSELE